MAQVYDLFTKKKIESNQVVEKREDSLLISTDSSDKNLNFSSQVITIEQARKALLDKDKRQTQRTILSDLVSVYAILPERGLLKVDVHNLGEKGLAFDIESYQGAYEINEKVAMRVYLNHKSYFPFEVEVKHVTPIYEEGIHRHGALFTGENTNNVALSHLIKFLEAVSTDLKEDHGDLMIPNIS